MNVKLISCTCNNPEEHIAYLARISNPDNQEMRQNEGQLFQYLLENKHFSPLEMVDMVFEINTTRDIARQMLRHKSFAFQEFSQRYATPSKLHSAGYREARMQDHANRQNSIATEDPEIIKTFKIYQEHVMTLATHYYNELLKAGLAKEQARAILPEGLTSSRLYMKGSLRSWIHYLIVRLCPTTQLEHRLIAGQIFDHLQILAPMSMAYVRAEYERGLTEKKNKQARLCKA